MDLAEQMVEHAFLNFIKKSKHKFVNIDAVSEFLKKKIGEQYTAELGIEVKTVLREDDRLDFFREGDYVHEMKFHYCTGNWLAIKGAYTNPVEAKLKMGWYAWQDTEEIDWDSLD
jgi:hypothetical protein